MKQELLAVKAAMERCDFATARDLATLYVNAHPDEFTDYYDMVASSVNESEALAKVVAAVDNLRNAGLLEHQMRAEAFHLHRWHPQNIGGHMGAGPQVRNAGVVHPAVRNN